MIERQKYIDRIRALTVDEMVTILVGARRSGKSTLLKLFGEYLVKTNTIQKTDIAHIDYENVSASDLLQAKALYSYVEKLTKGRSHDNPLYLFIDEVQEIERWAEVINKIRASYPVNLYVTGSNSRLFVGDYLTYLSGRYVSMPVFPLSFQEYFAYRAKEEKRRTREDLYNEYLEHGGFPATALSLDSSIIQAILGGLVDSVILQDAAQRSRADNLSLFKRVVQVAFDSIGSPLSANRIANTLKTQGFSANANTVDRYLQALCDAYVLYKCERFDLKGRHYLQTNPKYYVVDTGLRRAFLGTEHSNEGAEMENLVYLELLRRGYKVGTGISRKNGKEFEVDFVATNWDKKIYVQVCSSMLVDSTRKREFRALQNIPDDYPKYIITGDIRNYSQDGIETVYILDFLEGKEL